MNIVMYKYEQHGVDTYVCPLCAVIDIAAEGIMCASYNSKLEQLEDENNNDWEGRNGYENG